jgi:hypothetical protein
VRDDVSTDFAEVMWPLHRALSQRYFSIYFFQIFARRAKIWKKKSLYTLLPQANLADDYATA